jgi:hypothetical protein
MRYKLDSLLKINKHLGIALVELEKHPYIGSLQESRKLISLKLKLENIITKTIKIEDHAKREFFSNLKQ